LDSIDLEAIPEGEYEAGLAYNVKTGLARRVVSQLAADEIAGSPDIMGLRTIDGVRYAYVGDLKTGLGHHVPPVADCLQVRFYALAAARIMETDRAIAEVIRIGETGRVTTESVVLDNWHLDAIALELADIVRAVEKAVAVVSGGGSPLVATGLHCKFCPAFSACPEQRTLAVLMGQNGQALEKEIMTFLTPKTAKAAYLRTVQVLEIANRVKNAVYGFARENPIDLGDGLILGPMTVKRQALDGEVTHKFLTELYGRDGADSAVEMKATQTGIRRMLKSCGKPIAAGLREIMGALRSKGGITERRYERVDVHRIQAKELEEHEE